MIRVAIIIGSTRANRNGEAVARWVYEIAQSRTDARFELIDLLDFRLPWLDVPQEPESQQEISQLIHAWSDKIASFDAYIFVTPEYNHGVPGSLKNAIDHLYTEWHNKAAGFVSYGGAGGVRSVEQLRLIMAELQVADVRDQVALSLATDFEHGRNFKPAAYHEKKVNAMFNQVITWGTALKQVREKS